MQFVRSGRAGPVVAYVHVTAREAGGGPEEAKLSVLIFWVKIHVNTPQHSASLSGYTFMQSLLGLSSMFQLRKHLSYPVIITGPYSN